MRQHLALVKFFTWRGKLIRSGVRFNQRGGGQRGGGEAGKQQQLMLKPVPRPAIFRPRRSGVTSPLPRFPASLRHMSIKSDRWIRRMAHEHRMIEPFVDGQVRQGAISYGVS